MYLKKCEVYKSYIVLVGYNIIVKITTKYSEYSKKS